MGHPTGQVRVADLLLGGGFLGFVVQAELRQVSGTVERETAKDMIARYSPGAKRITLGADKGFDTASFVADMRDFNVTQKRPRFGHSLDSGSAMLSRDRISASTPNLTSASAAMSIRMAANT